MGSVLQTVGWKFWIEDWQTEGDIRRSYALLGESKFDRLLAHATRHCSVTLMVRISVFHVMWWVNSHAPASQYVQAEAACHAEDLLRITLSWWRVLVSLLMPSCSEMWICPCISDRIERMAVLTKLALLFFCNQVSAIKVLWQCFLLSVAVMKSVFWRLIRWISFATRRVQISNWVLWRCSRRA